MAAEVSIKQEPEIKIEKSNEEINFPEVSIKQEPELIIEDEIETDKIRKYLQKNDITEDDRLNLIWHSCTICYERFLNIEDLSLHVQSHEYFEISELQAVDEIPNSKKHFECSTCRKVCTTKQVLKNHQRIHTGEKPFKCVVNKQMAEPFEIKTILFAGKYEENGSSELILPEVTIKQESELKIEKCDEENDSSEIILTETSIKQEPEIKIEKCDKENDSSEIVLTEFPIKQEPELITEDEIESEKLRKYLKKNVITPENGLNLIWHSCTICDERFLNIEDLSLHVQSHEYFEITELQTMDEIPNSKKHFECSTCRKVCTTRLMLNKHQRIHAVEKPFKRDQCNRSLVLSRSRLSRHVLTHTEKELYKCHNCDRLFAQKGELQSHMMIHKPFKCDCCERSFIQSADLQRHMMTHIGEKPFKCNHCERSFSQRSSLRSHIITHSGEKPFKCTYCDSSFTQNAGLRRHIKIHTGEKPFKCDHCDRKFPRNASLQNHMMTHIAEKPFKCDQCNRSFTRRDNLQRHINAHKGEKPFKCHLCYGSFALRSNLQKHLMTHTREKP